MERTGRSQRVESGAAPARRGSLRRDIAWALALKTVALALLYLACFGPSHQSRPTADRVADALLLSAPSR